MVLRGGLSSPPRTGREGIALKKALRCMYSLNKKMCYVAMAAMFLLMCMTTIDIAMRKTATGGIADSFDITEIFMVLIIFCGFAFLESEKGHIRVDVLLNALPKTLRKIIDAATYLLSALILIPISYAMFQFIANRYHSGAATQDLAIPYWPFVVVVAVAFALFTITTALHAIEIVFGSKGSNV